MKKWLKQLFCWHDYEPDEDWSRFYVDRVERKYTCSKCGKKHVETAYFY